MNRRTHDGLIVPTDDARQSAATAPVSRPRRKPGAMTLEACYTRPTRPQGAVIGDALRLLTDVGSVGGEARLATLGSARPEATGLLGEGDSGRWLARRRRAR